MSDPAKEAKNMAAIYAAKKDHDIKCPWKGEGKYVHMHPFDIDRMSWEEGDVIAGLTLVSDNKVQPMRMVVHCDAEPKPDREQELEETVTDAVSKEDVVTV